LQKRLAESGMGSRRSMEELIEAGQVTVNGHVAKVGARVTIADEIAIAGKVVGRYRLPDAAGEVQILLYHKPEGEIASRSPGAAAGSRLADSTTTPAGCSSSPTRVNSPIV
jgi:23S rRNA pseudouridine2605 synthase